MLVKLVLSCELKFVLVRLRYFDGVLEAVSPRDILPVLPLCFSCGIWDFPGDRRDLPPPVATSLASSGGGGDGFGEA